MKLEGHEGKAVSGVWSCQLLCGSHSQGVGPAHHSQGPLLEPHI